MSATKSSTEVSEVYTKISGYFETLLLSQSYQSIYKINLFKKIFSQQLIICETVFDIALTSAWKNTMISIASMQEYTINSDMVLYVFASRNKPYQCVGVVVYLKLATETLQTIKKDKKTYQQLQTYIIDTIMHYVCVKRIKA